MSRRHNPNLSCEQLTHDLWCMIQKQLTVWNQNFSPNLRDTKCWRWCRLFLSFDLLHDPVWLQRTLPQPVALLPKREREREGEGASNHTAAHGFCQVHIQVLFLYFTAASRSRCQRSRMPANSHLVLLLQAQGDSPRVVDPKQENTECSPPLLGKEQGKDHQEKHLHATAVCNVCGKKQVLHYILSLAFLCCDMCPHGSP